MASVSSSPLQAAIEAVGRAFDKLEAVVDYAAAERDGTAAARETAQAEIAAGWQARTTGLEAELADSQSEATYLKEDNQRLSNQLQEVQQELLALQTTASGTVKKLDNSVRQLDLILERTA